MQVGYYPGCSLESTAKEFDLSIRAIFKELDVSLKEIRAAAVTLKLKLEEIETEAGAKGLESAFRTAKQKQVGAIMIGGGRVFLAERKRIVELAGYLLTEGICR